MEGKRTGNDKTEEREIRESEKDRKKINQYSSYEKVQDSI